MKSVLISIQPQWCKLIASGEKTIEVRKTTPQTDAPFKVYIYETKKGGCGKVIGEFVCKSVDTYKYGNMCIGGTRLTSIPAYEIDYLTLKRTCLQREELKKYGNYMGGHRKYLYGWNISALIIYKQPKELTHFTVNRYSQDIIDEGNFDCQKPDDCTCMDWLDGGDNCFTCIFGARKQLTRPPQSWCYVEEI
jgi:predicted transcriptional regulator